MRMWNVPASYLCDQHLLGEHFELHMIEGCVVRGTSVQGYIDRGLIQLPEVFNRHEEIVHEMVARGLNHRSDLMVPREEWAVMRISTTVPHVDRDLETLSKRCVACRERNKERAAIR